MSGTLLLIGIGPIQDFIASARKLRDLFFGSHVLSELSKTVARTLYENGAALIFPAIEDAGELAEGSDLNVANKILARVPSPLEAARLQQEAKCRWQRHMKTLAEKTLEEIGAIQQVKVDHELFRQQLGDYGEYFAAWADIDKAGGYAKARNRVEQLLAARKNLREFKSPGWDGRGRVKNSLDGMRESVIPDKAPEIIGLLKQNEKLDAMGCIKRFYPLSDHRLKKQHFFDLSDVAVQPWLQGIAADDLKRRAYLDFCGSVVTKKTKRKTEKILCNALEQPVVSDLFFAREEELAEALGEDKNAAHAWRARRKMVGLCGDPHLYAVVLLGDGDRVGQLIDAIDTEEGHIRFAREMSRFAGQARPEVEKHGGSLIYAGGDDVMAYLPLHTAATCADALRNRFQAIMEDVHRALDLACRVPTFSIGMAIVHYSFPLDQALALARSAERAAKRNGGRNALAIIQSKRSGSDIQIVGKWDARGDLPGVVRRLDAMVAHYNQPEAALPARLGYQLREARIAAGDTMAFNGADGKSVPANAAAALVKRILDHKNGGDGTQHNALAPLLAGRTSIREFSDELIVAHQIAQAVAMAEGKEKESR